jgi:hypothetical protein
MEEPRPGGKPVLWPGLRERSSKRPEVPVAWLPLRTGTLATSDGLADDGAPMITAWLAKALGLTNPPALLLRADQVIE